MRRVALLIETSRAYGRDLLKGVRRYSTENGSWSLFVEVRDLESKPPPWLKSWDGDGILTRSGSSTIAAAVKRAGVPAVELRSTRKGRAFPFVGVDNDAVGQLVAQYFLDRGFRHFGVYSLDSEQFLVDRRNSFVEALRRSGIECSEYRQHGPSERPSEWESQQAGLAKWIGQLPQQSAVMACTDLLGCWFLDACRRSGVRVPQDVAVVGVENDRTITTMSTPELSSVCLPGERIGYEAAGVLDRMMQGEKAPEEPLLLKPICVESRLSSDTLAIEDPLISEAIQLIHEKAATGLNVADVLAVVPISRSSLERNCRRIIGRSPNEEIVRVRIGIVCKLLRETDLTLEVVAERAGFSTSQYMLHVFRNEMGMTPGMYRRQQFAD